MYAGLLWLRGEIQPLLPTGELAGTDVRCLEPECIEVRGKTARECEEKLREVIRMIQERTNEPD